MAHRLKQQAQVTSCLSLAAKLKQLVTWAWQSNKLLELDNQALLALSGYWFLTLPATWPRFFFKMIHDCSMYTQLPAGSFLLEQFLYLDHLFCCLTPWPLPPLTMTSRRTASLTSSVLLLQCFQTSIHFLLILRQIKRTLAICPSFLLGSNEWRKFQLFRLFSHGRTLQL